MRFFIIATTTLTLLAGCSGIPIVPGI